MSLRTRSGLWHYRFKLDGKEYSATTGLAATRPNATAARQMEAEHRQALLEGRKSPRRIVVREFSDAVKQFLEWAKMEYRAHPNSYHRIKTSFASLKEFFGREAVSLIDEGRVENFKTWRMNEHEVRDITLRHDLHALSTFFKYAIKQRWAAENPIRKVKVPSDAEAVRIHVITPTEEKQYFTRAAKHPDLDDFARLIRNQGVRPEECIALSKPDVDLERGQIKIVWGKSPAAKRTLDLTAESKQILARRMKGISPWIFPSPLDHTKHRGRFNGPHDALCKEALEVGVVLNFVLYDWRHTFATEMAQAGVDLATLAAILGHSSLRLVQRYVHPTAEHKRNAMIKYDEALKIGREKAEQEDGTTQ